MDEVKRLGTKKPRSQSEIRGFMDDAGLLRMSRWCLRPVTLPLTIQHVREAVGKKMAENFEAKSIDWQALHDYERYKVPVRELSPVVDRHFQWEGWSESHPVPIQWLEHYAAAFHFHDAELLAARTSLHMPRASGVYFLFDGDECIYVGQTQNFWDRSEQHKAKGVEWTSHAYIEVPKFHAKEVEAYYIRRIQPPLNADYPRLRTYSDIVERLDLDRSA